MGIKNACYLVTAFFFSPGSWLGRFSIIVTSNVCLLVRSFVDSPYD